jgi:hypothetical protein
VVVVVVVVWWVLAAVMTRFVITRAPTVCRVFVNTYLPGPYGLMV